MTRTMPRTAARRVKGTHYMYGLDVLRVICAVGVVYNHVAWWTVSHGYDSVVSDVVEGGLVEPLHLGNRLGFLGVCAFFLITGLVVAHVSAKETTGQFLGRRFARLAPLLWVAVPLAWVLALAGLTEVSTAPGLGDLVANLLLVNHAVPGFVALLSVTWTLLLQVVFYLFAAVTIPLGLRWPWLPPVIGASVLSVCTSVALVAPPAVAGPLRTMALFLPVIFIGQLVGLARSRRVPIALGIGLGLVHAAIGVRATLLWPELEVAQHYARTLALLLLVVLLLTRADGRFVRSAPVRVVAQRTYAIYLLHVPVTFAVLGLAAAHVGYYAALALALVVLAAVVEAAHRLVERPIVTGYRRWEARRLSGSRPLPTP